MADPLSQVFFPVNFQELFAAWNRFPDASLYAGGTEHIRNQSRRIPYLPRNIISLGKLEELHRISRTERYVEIGAMVKLNQIIGMGKAIPEVLARCIENIPGPQLRNLATIGGNLCNPARMLDCYAPMAVLDAQFELRNAHTSRWVAASRFTSRRGSDSETRRQRAADQMTLGQQEILSRIRVPLEPWSFSRYHKLRSTGRYEPGGGLLFIMRHQKDILTQIRVIYSGKTILRDKNAESMLVGKRLPLDRKDAAGFVGSWDTFLSNLEEADYFLYPEKGVCKYPELIKAQIKNFIAEAVSQISD